MESLKEIIDTVKTEGLKVTEHGLDHKSLHDISAKDFKRLETELAFNAITILEATKGKYNSPAVHKKMDELKYNFLVKGEAIKMGPYEVADLNMVRHKARQDKTIEQVLETNYA